MHSSQQNNTLFIPKSRKPWPHEIRVAKILIQAGHHVIFLEETNIHSADIMIDGTEYEIKSPLSSSSNSLEHNIKKALRQSRNIIIDTSRIKYARDESIQKFLISQVKSRKQIKKLIMITKRGKIIDISKKV